MVNKTHIYQPYLHKLIPQLQPVLGTVMYTPLLISCRTMACFERDLHTLISGRDHVVLALYRRYL